MPCRFVPGQFVRPIVRAGIDTRWGWYGPEYRFRLSTNQEAPDLRPIRPSFEKPLAWAIHLQVYKLYAMLPDATEAIERHWQCWQLDLDFEPVYVPKHPQHYATME